jgi:hypothetical protein
MPVIELPLGVPSRIFQRPIPLGPSDLHGEVYHQFRAAQWEA